MWQLDASRPTRRMRGESGRYDKPIRDAELSHRLEEIIAGQRHTPLSRTIIGVREVQKDGAALSRHYR
jgi:hypothetical protein